MRSLVNGVGSLKAKAWLRSRLCLKNHSIIFVDPGAVQDIERRPRCSQCLDV